MNKSVVLLSILANFFLLLAIAAPVQAQGPATNPYALYGGCWKGVPYNASEYRFKIDGLEETGFITKLANVAGIVVLDCHHWDGGGGFFVTDCPAGSPYSFCVQNNNDGRGNHIYMGVLELNSTTDPNTQYGGCAPGSGFRKKADVLLGARPNIRNINSIIVTECHAADGAPGTVRVPCPKGSFYAACFQKPG